MSHISCSQKCGRVWGNEPHTPKWLPLTLEIGILMDFQNFQKQLQGSKPIELKNFFYRMNALGTWMSKMGLHHPFEHFKHKLWPKEGNCLDFLTCRWHATYRWKAFDEGYNVFSDLISIGGLHIKLWAPNIAKVSTLGISETKWHLGAGHVARHRVYYKGGGGGFPQVQAVVSLVSPCLLMIHSCTKMLQLCTN